MNKDRDGQSLDDFCTDMQKDLERFKANWLKEREKNPDNWPLSMGAGDWYEQFLMFLSQGTES